MEQAELNTGEIENRLLNAVERMPAFPSSVQKILELSNDINCPPKELVSVIQQDPVMTMKILRVINSAYYSLPNRINSVSQSVVYLGINTIKNLALAIAAVGVLPKRSPRNFDIQRYLIHSLNTAGLSRQLCMLAEGDLEPGDAYIAGLLHDFGKVVLAQFMSSDYEKILSLTEQRGIPLDVAEREVLGVDHALVGAMLTRRWQFPYDLSDCIADHHNPDAEASLLLDCVKVANQISRYRKLGDGRNPFREGEQLATTRFGTSFDEVIKGLGDIQRISDEANLFASIGSS
ncbi:MAG: HDOD domain-containing protein [Gammaproteobacteria bacterium]|nr:HDOD domain-containing protein [Pseudomonadales bacterium]MCP5347401.1 HDOD domain-containing protein [Pseudomonadales bacterium]